ncbi:MAG: hypothetical protein AAB944_00990 [Patescibacteria group bacterium]
MENEVKHFTRKETIVLIAVCFVLYGIGQYYFFSRFVRFAVPAPSSVVPALPSNNLPQSFVAQLGKRFTVNSLIGKILSIKTENANTLIEISFSSNGSNGIENTQKSAMIKVTQNTKITKQVLRSQSEIDAIVNKYHADIEKNPKTPLPVDQLVVSVKTLSISDLKIGNLINVHPLENIVGKAAAEIKELTAETILQW